VLTRGSGLSRYCTESVHSYSTVVVWNPQPYLEHNTPIPKINHLRQAIKILCTMSPYSPSACCSRRLAARIVSHRRFVQNSLHHNVQQLAEPQIDKTSPNLLVSAARLNKQRNIDTRLLNTQTWSIHLEDYGDTQGGDN